MRERCMQIAGAAGRREPPPDTQRIKLGLGGECIAPKLFPVLFVLCLASAHGALDPNFGPRVHPELGSISALQRQLQEAALMGDTMLLNITNLITAGADPNGYDEQHMTPLHWAVIKGQRLCVELLLQRGAHTDVRDSSDRTPLHFVAIYGWGTEFPSILTALYFAGANFNAGDQSLNTPLHLAAFEGKVQTVNELIKYGAKLDRANLWQQRTPLGMAKLAEHTDVIDALTAAGATQEYITMLPGCTDPPCTTLQSCTDDRSNLERGANKWGCYQNNLFIQEQPVDEPQPPGPPEMGEQLNLIQGTCVS